MGGALWGFPGVFWGDPPLLLPPPPQSLLALLDAALAEVGGDGSAPQRHLRVTALLSATETLVRAAALRMRGHSDGDVLTSANGTGMGTTGAAP